MVLLLWTYRVSDVRSQIQVRRLKLFFLFSSSWQRMSRYWPCGTPVHTHTHTHTYKKADDILEMHWSVIWSISFWLINMYISTYGYAVATLLTLFQYEIKSGTKQLHSHQTDCIKFRDCKYKRCRRVMLTHASMPAHFFSSLKLSGGIFAHVVQQWLFGRRGVLKQKVEGSRVAVAEKGTLAATSLAHPTKKVNY